MSFATLTTATSSTGVIRARVKRPSWGIWSALVTLSSATVALTGSVVLTLGPLVLVGTIRRGGPFVGRGQYRIYGGADGWSKTIPANSYRNPQTALSTLAQDAAALVGETVVMDLNGERVVGPYTRFSGPASDVLSLYSPQRWWVEVDGTTHIGDRTPLPSPSSVQLLDFDPDLGVALVNDETALVGPGQAFASGTAAGTVSTVFHDLEDGALRTDVYLQ